MARGIFPYCMKLFFLEKIEIIQNRELSIMMGSMMKRQEVNGLADYKAGDILGS